MGEQNGLWEGALLKFHALLKGDLGKFEGSLNQPPFSAPSWAEEGREEKMRNLKIMPGSDEIDVRDYITNRIAASYNFFPAKNDSPLPRAPRMNNLSKVKPEIEKRRREGEWRTGRKPRVYLCLGLTPSVARQRPQRERDSGAL